MCFPQWSSDHGFLGKPRKIKARKNVIVQEVTVESHENPMLRESKTKLTKTLGCASTLTSKLTLNEFCFKIFYAVKYTVWPATGTGKQKRRTLRRSNHIVKSDLKLSFLR